MSAEIVDFPTMSLERAREIIATPDLFGGGQIVKACKVLFAYGTAADMRMVLALQQSGIVAGFEPAQSPPLRALRRRKWQAAMLALYVLAAAALGTAVLASLLFNAIKAML
ncbi:hypothetical protein O9Z70_13395 [Devosia sp. YIM 151766]|uniref:hypothetical protein n=1 Tax=Devosia sp. YIM 151766 TaxID=3017325 RepID=UPI00255CFB38|nr:hypothetical protein [Devosia sp. YIM 151766]WIY52444.1 hypothetical protein O9Z70_13395 [Devosia sp. YIM 151766]